MDIQVAQRENRHYFVGGFYGQLVSGVLWLIAAGLATWSTPRAAITTLMVSGFFIFPLTVFLIRVTRGPRGAGAHNPLNTLGMQVALVMPFSMTVLLGVGLYRLDWIFPATTILLGAHYLPFAFLYGMRTFLALAAVLLAGGVSIVMFRIPRFTTDVWFTAGTLILSRSCCGRSSRGRVRRVPESARAAVQVTVVSSASSLTAS